MEQLIQVMENGRVMYELTPEETKDFIIKCCPSIDDPEGTTKAILDGCEEPCPGPRNLLFKLKQ